MPKSVSRTLLIIGLIFWYDLFERRIPDYQLERNPLTYLLVVSFPLIASIAIPPRKRLSRLILAAGIPLWFFTFHFTNVHDISEFWTRNVTSRPESFLAYIAILFTPPLIASIVIHPLITLIKRVVKWVKDGEQE